MKDAATKSYGRKGEKVVKMNHDAIDAGAQAIVEVKVPAEWADAEGDFVYPVATGDRKDLVDFVNNIQTPVNAQRGDKLPVSTFLKDARRYLPAGLFRLREARYRRRCSGLEPRQLHPVQLLLLCLPARRYPSGRSVR